MIQAKYLRFSLWAFFLGCGTQNVAKDFIDDGKGDQSAESNPSDPASDQVQVASDEAEAGSATDDGVAGDSGDEGEAPVGDVANGEILLQSCVGCHNSSGLGKSVKLDAYAVSRLEDAYNGPQKAIHSVFSEAFEQPNRADLEAALDEIK